MTRTDKGVRRVAVADAVDLLQPGVDLMRERGVDVSVPPPGETPEAMVDRAAGAPVLILGLCRLGAAELGRLAAGGTRLIVRAGIGYDIVDLPAASAAGVTVANVPDYCVDEVADHSLLLLLAAQRRLGTLAGLWHDGWAVADRLPTVSRVAGATLGVVGLGRIGTAVARRAAGFGWRVVAHDPYVTPDAFAAAAARPVELDDLFAAADAITLHCPLSAGNAHLVDARRLGLVRRGAVLVNTSRGGLVDLDAVDAAVADGRLGAVALDVLDGEPDPPLCHPLLSRPEVTVTPHVAWYSVAARHELAIKSAEEALRWLDTGAARHPVNRP
jgi:lactate dehydrogenase-like 2-hydroxyacid dehydrogenase